MPNGREPDPRGLTISVTGHPGQKKTWRTAALPPTHHPNQGYWISKEDGDAILAAVKQQVELLQVNAPRVPGVSDVKKLDTAQPADAVHNGGQWPVQGDPPPTSLS